MTGEGSKDILTEGNNYLAALHSLKFSQKEDDASEEVDIYRRTLALKYLTARMLSSESIAACLLNDGLDNYHNYIEKKDGVNNYWKQFKALCPEINNDPIQWKSTLTDPADALQFIKSLSCQKDKTLPCANMFPTDRQIERIVGIWKDEDTAVRKRKIHNKNIAEEDIFLHTENDNKTTDVKDNISRLQSTCNKLNPIKHTNKLQANIPTDCSSSVPRDRYNRGNLNKNSITSKPPTYSSFDNEESEASRVKINPFKTAAEIKKEQQAKGNKPVQKKTLGGRAPVNAPFVCPLKRTQEENMEVQSDMTGKTSLSDEINDERLKNIEPKMVELIKNEIMDSGTPISWDDIAGLEYAKKIIKEVVVFPMLRPDIFTGLRRPPRGILLFGPPGTGKTLIGKCIASQSKSTFFSISASSLTSKWIGEGEKMVRALFAVARVHQPSVIFIDEIDSLLTQRSETEHESSRRIKTEFLVQLDGAATSEEDRLLIVGATNRPQELDEAARRRLVKRLYIPLPEMEARKQIVTNLLASIPHNLTEEDVSKVAKKTEGYSGADMTNLCKEASMGPIRSIPFSQLENVRTEDVRKVTAVDFEDALRNVRPSVSQNDLSVYIQWDNTYGSGMSRNQIK